MSKLKFLEQNGPLTEEFLQGAVERIQDEFGFMQVDKEAGTVNLALTVLDKEQYDAVALALESAQAKHPAHQTAADMKLVAAFKDAP